MNASRTSLSALLLMICLSNCATIHKVNQAERHEIKFVSATAADTFYRAMIRNTTPHNDKDERTLMIGVKSPYQYRRIDSDHVIFNRASKKADADGNGWISENEAAAYAEATDTTVNS